MFVPRSVSFSKSNTDHSTKKQLKLPNKDVKIVKSVGNSSKTEPNDELEFRPTSVVEKKCQRFDSESIIDPKERNEEEAQDSGDNDEQVIEKCKDQRYPKTGEPVCVVCGRYGAYICDQTDKDVCSIECKHININKTRLSTGNDALAYVSEKTEAVKNSEYSANDKRAIDGNFADNVMAPTEFELFFKKNYVYKEHVIIANLPLEKIDFLREKLEIKLQGINIPSLNIEFNHCGFNSTLKDNLIKNNYITPTPIQMQAIPIGLSGRDLIACAHTGTGKSASFLLPLIQKVSSTTGLFEQDSPLCSFPLALILCPTRELGIQLEHQTKIFSKGLRNVKTALIIGGNPLPQQVHRLKQGVQIIIATPGRLHDLIEKHKECCNLDYIQVLVLDEVDTMLQLGFQSQVDKILEHVRISSQKMMLSATIPPSIEKMASKLLQNPVFVSVGEPSAPNKSVKQIILWVEDSMKKRRLFDIIKDKRHFCSPAVVFVDSKIGADMLADAISKVCGITCASIHGDKLQSDRTQILYEFLEGNYDVLVSTSLLGRGVDLLNVKLVINFDMPSSVEEYIHQVGRAGKLDAKGFAITFINNNNHGVFLSLTETLQISDVKVPAEILNSPYLQQQKERRQRKHGTKRKRRFDDLVTTGNLMDMLKGFS